MSIGTLKNIALITMVIDHIGYFFNDYPLSIYFRIVGRIAAPIFMFCFVEGYLHTSNRNKYKQRLGVAAVIMGTINLWMIMIGLLINNPLPTSCSPLIPNIFLTLFIMLILIETIDNYVSQKNNKYDFFKFFLIILVPFMEYSYLAFSTIIIFRYIKDKNFKLIIYVVVSILICLLQHNYIQIFMILTIPFLYNYNGEKGKSNKWFFYIFYPTHFYIIWIMSILIR